ncbi:MAG: TonB family protein [Bacteroidales bacterium]
MNRLASSIIIAALFFLGQPAFAQKTVEGIEKSLKNYVEFISADSLMGRAAGSKGEKIVASFIYDELEKSGITMLSPRSGEDFYIAAKDTIHSRNIIGVVQGYDTLLKNEYVVIGAHIDHLGVNKLIRDGKEEIQIYPGADDNASGVATVLEIAKQVVAHQFLFRRSVIFAFFGAEEVGMAGSWYFLNRSFKEIDKIVMMINLDMVGRSGGENKPQVFTASQNPEITSILNDLSNRTFSVKPVLSSTDYFPSDHVMFYEKNIPIALFTTGTHRDYHTIRDKSDRIDYNQMEYLAEYVYSLAEAVANRDARISPSIRTETVNNIGNKDKKEIIYTQQDVDKKALFLHGDEVQFLNRWVYPYIKYPDSAIAAGFEGRVIVEFIIEKDGSVSNVKIVRGIDNDIDDEVIKVVSASPKWKAAQYNGSSVRVKISIPVEFKLAKSSKFKLKK